MGNTSVETRTAAAARALDQIVTSLGQHTALLAESEQYFNAITQQSLMGIYVATRDRILYANKALASRLGYKVDEVLALSNILDLIHPDDRPTVLHNYERRFRGETFRASFRMLRKDGGIVLVEADGRRVLRRGEPVIIGSIVALDAIKRDRAKARRERQALLRSEKMAALGELLGGLAHEMNNPLMAVMGQANVIERIVGPGPVAERAHKIAEQAGRAAKILLRFTTFVRDHPPEIGLVALNTVVRDVTELFDYSLRRGRIDVALELTDPLPDAWADAHRLHELVAHLVANALQAMREGPAPRRLTVRTLVAPETTRIVLEVSDTGPGVSAEARPRLFEAFFTTKPAGIGTGLGLFVCLEIAQESGDSIILVDHPGPGATFRVEFPQRAPADG